MARLRNIYSVFFGLARRPFQAMHNLALAYLGLSIKELK